MDTYKSQRRMLWMGKFAFHKINTKKTRVMMVPDFTNYIETPVMDGAQENWYKIVTDKTKESELSIPETRKYRVTLEKFIYNGKRWKSVIVCGYNEEKDTLVVKSGSFSYYPNLEFYMD